jgi:hypothetical protein
VGGAQWFLSAFSGISPHFRRRRHLIPASDYRAEMTVRFAIWSRQPQSPACPPRREHTAETRLHHAPAHHQTPIPQQRDNAPQRRRPGRRDRDNALHDGRRAGDRRDPHSRRVSVARDCVRVCVGAPLVLIVCTLVAPLTAVDGSVLLGLFTLFVAYVTVRESRGDTPVFR